MVTAFFNTSNIPSWDDYGAILGFINRAHDAPSLFHQVQLMFGKYAEHRIFYVKLITLLDYYLFGQVNLIRLNFIGNLGLLGIAVILFKTIKPVDNRWLFFLLVLYLLFQLQYIGIIFSPMSALQNINTVLFALASLYFLNKKETKYFILALLFAVVGCFSSGNGMFIFMAGLLILFSGNYSYIYKSI